MVERRRHLGGQTGGQLERLGMAHLEGRRVVQLGGLFLDRLDDLRAAVAGIAAPQSGGAVEHLAAVGCRVVHVLGADQHARIGLELAVRRERHPESFEIVRRHCSIGHHCTTLT
jgi:hypothetical protein